MWQDSGEASLQARHVHWHMRRGLKDTERPTHVPVRVCMLWIASKEMLMVPVYRTPRNCSLRPACQLDGCSQRVCACCPQVCVARARHECNRKGLTMLVQRRDCLWIVSDVDCNRRFCRVTRETPVVPGTK